MSVFAKMIGKNRDEEFVHFFVQTCPKLKGAIYLSGGGASTEDIAQEAMARVYAHWKSVGESSNREGYLFVIAYRLLAKELKSLQATSPKEEEELQIEAEVEVDSFEASQLDRLELYRVIDFLPPQQRACFVGRYIVGLSSNELSEALGIKPSSVRKHIELAKKRLREVLSEKSEDTSSDEAFLGQN
ncbi:MAG: sigma-70 family RNA polymerase sigma factor [Acidimicrobiaceae bacterium]|nr:sigma-70 family RNA polymerase sigma factor [Acidimicrobiaceae bacterium]